VTPVGTNWVTTTIAGLADHTGSVDGTNKVARFFYPAGVAVDAGGNVYVADSENNTIRKLKLYGTNWVTSTLAGSAMVYGDNDGTNNNSRFNIPNGLAIDAATNLYVADTSNDTIRKLTPIGTNWVSSTIGGLTSNRGITDGTNSAARFWGPAGIAS